MELWIRSQDKRDLMKAEHIIVVGCCIEVANLDTRLTFAQFDSEERALEVLDEIEEHLDYLNIGNIDRVDDKGFRVSTIYQMPEV